MANSEQASSVSGPLATTPPVQNIQASTENSLIPITSHKLTTIRSVVKQGDNPLALHVSQTFPSSWIVGSRASDHMTGDRTLFSSYYPYHGTLTVRTTDGTCSKVAGIGIVKLPEL